MLSSDGPGAAHIAPKWCRDPSCLIYSLRKKEIAPYYILPARAPYAMRLRRWDNLTPKHTNLFFIYIICISKNKCYFAKQFVFQYTKLYIKIQLIILKNTLLYWYTLLLYWNTNLFLNIHFIILIYMVIFWYTNLFCDIHFIILKYKKTLSELSPHVYNYIQHIIPVEAVGLSSRRIWSYVLSSSKGAAL